VMDISYLIVIKNKNDMARPLRYHNRTTA